MLEVEDAETGELLLLDTFDSNVRTAYHDLAVRHQADRERLFRSMKMDAIHVRTDEPYVQTLVSFFRRRASRY